MRWFVLLLALIAAPLSAQTVEDRLVKARTEVNAAQNANSRALYAIDRALEAVHAEHMPMPIPAAPLTVADIKPLASNFDEAPLIAPNAVPKSAAPDVVGAFRFVCNVSHYSYDDPIVYPGQPGKAHLHAFFGNSETNAASTYETLRAKGDGTCHGGPLNRSAYWFTALLDGAGNTVVPDNIVVYYKRRPVSDPQCQVEGKGCVGIPPGLRAIFGTNYSTAADPSPHVAFRCNGPSGDDVKYGLLGPAVAKCAVGNKIVATIHVPKCWDGVHLDSADHQSHLAHELVNKTTGKPYCPATHPYIIPELTLTFTWSILAGDDPTKWIFSSDVMMGKPAGASFHADYMEAWAPDIRLTWEGNCLDKLLNCSDGNLGNGTKMKRPAGFTFEQRPHLVPVPAR
jgi:hypothetical protein